MGPLKNIRIIEFAGIGPAPFCGMLLADLGADVVRIDRYNYDYLFQAFPGQLDDRAGNKPYLMFRAERIR